MKLHLYLIHIAEACHLGWKTKTSEKRLRALKLITKVP